MRMTTLSSIGGAVVFATLAFAAPAALNPTDTCAPSITTVFVTIEPATITLHDAPTSTIYAPGGQGAESLVSTAAFTDVNSNSPVSAEPSFTDDVVTVINTIMVTAQYTAPVSRTTDIISYYVSGTSTVYLNGPPPAASESIVYAGSETLTIEPVQSGPNGLETTTIHGHTTIHVTEHRTVTGTLSEESSTPGTGPSFTGIGTLSGEESSTTGVGPSFGGISTLSSEECSTLSNNPTFTGIGSGGWNGTEGGSYPTGTEVTGISPTGTGAGVTSFPAAAATVSTTSFAAQEGFGASDPASLSTAEPTFDFTKTFSPVSLSTMAAQSGFNAFSSISYPNGTSTTASSTSAPSSTSAIYADGTYTTAHAISAPSVTQSGLSNNTTGTSTIVSSTGSLSTAVSNSAPWSNFNSSVTMSAPTSVSGGNSGASATVSSSHNSSVTVLAPTSSFGDNSGASATAVTSIPLNSSTIASSATNTGLNQSSTSSFASDSGPSATIVPTSVPQNTSTVATSSPSTSLNQSSTSAFASSFGASTTAAPTSVPLNTSTITTSSSSNYSSTSVASSASPSASTCGEIGDFVLNFDDIPPLAASADADPQPVFSPYHQFDFSNGYVVAPPPKDPYLPSSPPQLTQFIPNFTVGNSTAASGPNSVQGGFAGDIGNGDHDGTGCFRFNFYGASIGCDSQGPSCVFTFTGIRHDLATGKDVAVTSEMMAIDACPELVDCPLTPVTFDSSFSNLSVIRMQLTVGGEPKIWWMDDIKMGWYDNSCAMGMCRTNTHIHKRQLKSNVSKLRSLVARS